MSLLLRSRDLSENQGIFAHIWHGQFTKYTESCPYKHKMLFFCICRKEGSQMFIKCAPEQYATKVSIWANPPQLCDPSFCRFMILGKSKIISLSPPYTWVLQNITSFTGEKCKPPCFKISMIPHVKNHLRGKKTCLKHDGKERKSELIKSCMIASWENYFSIRMISCMMASSAAVVGSKLSCERF